MPPACPAVPARRLSYLHAPHATEPADVVLAREHGEKHDGSHRRPDNVLHRWASFLSTERQQVPSGTLGMHSVAPRQPAGSYGYLPRACSPRAEGRAEMVPSTLPMAGIRIGAESGV